MKLGQVLRKIVQNVSFGVQGKLVQVMSRVRLKHCETPVLTCFGIHMIMQTLATGSQGFDPKRGILLQPHLITSACPPLWTLEPASVPAISNPLHHNSAYSAPHPFWTLSHHPSDPSDFHSGASPPCPFVLLAIGRVDI